MVCISMAVSKIVREEKCKYLYNISVYMSACRWTDIVKRYSLRTCKIKVYKYVVDISDGCKSRCFQ